MTHEYYEQESARLREVLEDAEARGDIYLEYDVKEALVKLRDRYYNEEIEE